MTTPWIVHILLALWSKDPRTGMTKSDLDWNVRLLRHKDGLALPKAFAETTQSCIQRHTSESGEWKTDGAKQENDILYSPGAKGSGTWAIKYKDRALRKILAGLRVTPEQFATIVEETNKTLGR